MADQFCLRWNNFQTNIVSALDSLKCSEDLVDVTLTCEGKNIKAHKVILSACSPYFRSVFKENPCQHPVIILKDVLADDIVSLLSYMYQGEVFIEESKLSSFLHTAALLQVKGLTGVTQQRENLQASPNTSNKLYTQLTISSKTPYGLISKDTKTQAPKKRRSSTSDKPNDVSPDNYKKGKIMEAFDLYTRNAFGQPSKDTLQSPENNHDKKLDCKNDNIVNANGRGTSTSQTPNITPEDNVVVKIEKFEDDSQNQGPLANSDNENESLPDYENSMLARSLLSGINPSKSDTNSSPIRCKILNKIDGTTSSRQKETNESDRQSSSANRSPQKTTNTDENSIKSVKQSPKSDVEYEPEILLSEQHDGTDSEGGYSQEQSQALLLLAGMSTVPMLNAGASTSQSTHQQSNHAAICGDCPHCGKKYSNQSALKYHVRLMHSDLTNRLCCYLCPRSFTMRETFKEHMWSTHGQRN